MTVKAGLCFAIAALLLSCCTRAYPQDPVGPNAPTAAAGALAIDKIWQDASAPYDGKRIEILNRVDPRPATGPFVPIGSR